MARLSEADLVAAVTRDRAAGKRVALAAVCFDVLGVSDVRVLQAAASRADRLVVAVLDDEAVRAKLGEGRPVVTLEDRAEIVDCVRGVDYVVVCARDDVDRLASILLPDVRE
jgi:D-beta-D-heptose 7-phosphate kinase/D-beta-D-heptose 1-phosphate adenosyltransferase